MSKQFGISIRMQSEHSCALTVQQVVTASSKEEAEKLALEKARAQYDPQGYEFYTILEVLDL